MKNNRWKDTIFSLTILFFCLNVLIFPVCMHFAYAGGSSTPASVLTYTKNDLEWDSSTAINADGSADLGYFADTYGHVSSSDGTKILAPGTKEEKSIRLKNNVSGPISYKALVFGIADDDSVPLGGILESTGSTVIGPADYPTLPAGIPPESVLKAVSGTISGHQMEDFSTGWKWDYDDGVVQDGTDTVLGGKPTLDGVKFGLYIVVEDENSYSSGGGGATIDPDGGGVGPGFDPAPVPGKPDNEFDKDALPADTPDVDDTEDPGLKTPDAEGDRYVRPHAPKTGDQSMVQGYLVLMVISMVTVIILFVTRQRKEEED